MFVFQGVFFRTFYTTKTIRTVKEEIASLKNQDEYSKLNVEELIFSKNTQTITSLLSKNQVEQSISKLDLTILSVETESNTYELLVPKSSGIDYSIGQKITAVAYETTEGAMIPVFLSVDDETLIRSQISDQNNDLFLSLESNEQHQIDGIVSSIYENSRVENNSLNSIISNELLNILSKNYISSVSFEDGFYYFSNGNSFEDTNLVFYSEIEIDGNDYILLSIYQMNHIDDIVNTAATVNLYMFLVVLLILMIASLIYSREFSKPLLYINNASRKLSQLDFSEPLLEINSSDEFAELSRNINILTVSLKTTLYRLNDQNKKLSENLINESNSEGKRRDFVSGMSHELKTPLAVIQASAEALQNDVYDTKEEKDDALILIQKEVSKTNKMIKDMMNVYKMDIPDYQKDWETVNVKNLITNIDSTLKLLYTNSDITVKMELEDVSIEANKDNIETIIINLFTNAIKYTPNGSQIHIKLYSSAQNIKFEITNFGVSISKEEQQKIFEPFYRVTKARSREEGSTGLGLYIVNQMLERYSSVCEVESTTDSVTFMFQIKKSN